MKIKIFVVILIFGIYSFLLSNPIDNTPITIFSELVFNDNDNWTMELLMNPFPYPENIFVLDSITLKVANIESRLKPKYSDTTIIGVITGDSLTVPLKINMNGDKIEIYTYSHIEIENIIGDVVFRKDSLVFGDYPGATVGRPAAGYSIIRNRLNAYLIDLTIDCFSQNPSLGAVNDTVGLSSILKGRIYDVNNKIVTKLKDGYFFILETLVDILPGGFYSTKIFPRFEIETKDHLSRGMKNFETWGLPIEIEPIELKNICPGTINGQDIYLKSSCDICDITEAVKSDESLQNPEYILINYPNPFNSSTNFFVKIPDKLKEKPGEIEIYNINGQLIRTIPIKGSGTIHWDGKNMNGSIMPSGIYYYRLNIDKQIMKNGSMILLK